MKKFFIIATVCLLSIALIATFSLMSCKPEEEQTVAEEDLEETSEEMPEETTEEDVGTSEDTSDIEIIFIHKYHGSPWIDINKIGVEEFCEEHGIKGTLTGPVEADAVMQAQLVEDYIAKGVDAIIIVPNDPVTIEPVLKKANDAGIVTITHEASTAVNVSYDLEAFTNKAYGEKMMQIFAEYMGEEGGYVAQVGFLTSVSHNEWIDAAVAYQKENYPNMYEVTERVEDEEDEQKAHDLTLELINTYPDLKGMIGAPMAAPLGGGLAVEELSIQDEFVVVGTCIPSISSQYIESDAVKAIMFWSPYAAGWATSDLALKAIMGQEVMEGDDLGVDGYNSVTIDGKVVYGNGMIVVTKDNLAENPEP